MSNSTNRKWHRTTVTRRDGTLHILKDNWSLINLPTGLAVAQLRLDTVYQDKAAWRVIYRSMNVEGMLKDSIMTWMENPTKAREYAEAQTGGLNYRFKRKRTKEEILGRPPKR